MKKRCRKKNSSTLGKLSRVTPAIDSAKPSSWVRVPSTGLPALAFLLIPFADSFTELAVLVSLTGICNGLSLGSMSVSTFDVVPAGARGRLQAARRMIAEMGGALAPVVGGYLANRFYPGVPFFVYVPILLAAALFLALVGKETRPG